jgi:hypothetical protein
MRDWKAQLDAYFQPLSDHPLEDPHVARYEDEAAQFIKDIVWAAFEDIGQALRARGREFSGNFSDTSATGIVGNHGLAEFQYILEVRLTPRGAYPRAKTRHERTGGVFGRGYTFGGKRAALVTKDDISRHFVHTYLHSFSKSAG